MSMEMLLKVATPLTADTVRVPDNVPLPGSLLIANVIESVAVLIRFPPASCTWTSMAGEMEVTDCVLLGSTLKPSCAGGPKVMLKPVEVASVRPLAVASRVYPVPTLSMEISLKVATPLTADIVNVPDKVPLPGLLFIARVTESVAVGTKLPPASTTWTSIAGEIEVTDCVLLGSTL